MRTKGSAAELEVKRRIACNLLLKGTPRAEVARIVGTSWTSVNRWKKAIEKGGIDAIAAKPHPGRRPFLSRTQQKKLLRILERGALKAGFPNDLWNSPRVAAVIERQFGVKYHESHVLKLLAKWGWSRQKPQRRAREQNRLAVENWRTHEWERLKKGAREQS